MIKVKKFEVDDFEWNTIVEDKAFRIQTEEGEFDLRVNETGGLEISTPFGHVEITPRVSNVIWVRST